MTWHTVGHGAISSLIASQFYLAGINLQLILRDKSNRTLDFQYLNTAANIPESESPIKEYPAPNNQAHSISLQAVKPEMGEITNLLSCVKAYDQQAALSSLLPYLADNANIILMHNGMGCAEQILPNLKTTQKLYLASTTHGAFKPTSLQVNHTGLGETHIGAFQDKTNQSIKKLTSLPDLQCGFSPVFWDDNIEQKLWQKLAVNLCINPLTALHQIKNGELLAPIYQSVISKLVDEFVEIAYARQFGFEPKVINQTVQTVTKQTAGNFSSMNRDVFYNRTTEIDYINGYLMGLAEQHNIHCPTIKNLYEKIKQRLR